MSCMSNYRKLYAKYVYLYFKADRSLPAEQFYGVRFAPNAIVF